MTIKTFKLVRELQRVISEVPIAGVYEPTIYVGFDDRDIKRSRPHFIFLVKLAGYEFQYLFYDEKIFQGYLIESIEDIKGAGFMLLNNPYIVNPSWNDRDKYTAGDSLEPDTDGNWNVFSIHYDRPLIQFDEHGFITFN